MAVKKNISFEEALARMDEIVSRLDSGELPLEESLLLFSEGSELVAFCGKKLEKAKLTVETLFPEKTD